MQNMKKLLIIIGLGLLLTGCGTNNNNSNEKENPYIQTKPIGGSIVAYTFEYNGHRYIEFMARHYRPESGFIHDPDCLLEDLKKEKENRELN